MKYRRIAVFALLFVFACSSVLAAVQTNVAGGNYDIGSGYIQIDSACYTYSSFFKSWAQGMQTPIAYTSEGYGIFKYGLGIIINRYPNPIYAAADPSKCDSVPSPTPVVVVEVPVQPIIVEQPPASPPPVIIPVEQPPYVLTISNIRKYDSKGKLISGRDYFVGGDRIELDVKASERSDISLQASGFGGANCWNTGGLNYHCIYSVSPYAEGKTTLFVNGLNYVTRENKRVDLSNTEFNPPPQAESGDIVFGKLVPGTTVYSNVVTINADQNTDIYLMGLNTYSPIKALCGRSNSFPYYYVDYKVNDKMWQTITPTYRWIGKGDLKVQFRANVPSVCYGSFDIAERISFYYGVSR